MYQSEFFQINSNAQVSEFKPAVISVYKILADNSYFHYCDDEEKTKYQEGAYAFIFCTDGEGKIYLKNKIIIINKNQYVFLKFTDIEKYKSLSNIWGYRWVNFTAKNVRDEFETDKIYCASFCEKNEAAFSELLNYGKSFSRDLNYVNALFLSYYYSVTSKNHIAQDESEGSQSKLIDEIINLFIASLSTSLVLKRLTKRHCQTLKSLIGNTINSHIVRNDLLALEKGHIDNRIDSKLLIPMIKVIKRSGIANRNQSIAIDIDLIGIYSQHISLGLLHIEIKVAICHTARQISGKAKSKIHIIHPPR